MKSQTRGRAKRQDAVQRSARNTDRGMIQGAREIVELKIDSMSDESMGVARLDGVVYFIKYAITGELVRAKVTKKKKRFAFAESIEVLEESPYKNPDYEVLRAKEGGSTVLKLSYEQQCKEKRAIVEQSFAKIAHIDLCDGMQGASRDAGSEEPQGASPAVGLDFYPSPEQYRYRNKAIYPAAYNAWSEVDFGSFMQESHELVFGHDSILEHEHNAELLVSVKEWAAREHISAYDIARHQGLLRSVLIRNNVRGEAMLCLVLNASEYKRLDAFATFIRARHPYVVQVGAVYNRERGPVQLSNSYECVGEPFVDALGSFIFELAPHSFFQVNRAQAEVLYAKALEYAVLQGDETVWDIYAGVGTISAHLAKTAKQVYANEYVEEAVEDAKRNMAANSIANMSFEAGAAEQVIPRWLKSGLRPDVVVVDPPRKGVAESVLDAIAKAAPSRIVYVSCKPSTLARDVAYLGEKGYVLKKVSAFDMFPQTMHVECVALLERV